ncbi:MAG: class I SAM-dependent methyltransferase [Actinomycetota bacterium]|nr:class I SAM-dependent methyltransferase [Actinomycetota bacterium]
MRRGRPPGSQGSRPESPAQRADLWSGRADAYRSAVEHAEGADLDLIVSWCAREAETALDVATGGGHVARALRSAGVLVTTLDPAPGMGADVIARAEDIPFADASFDAVVTRIAPHHFDDVRLAVREMARVARRLVVVADTLHAGDEVEEAERLRDPTHVRSYSEDEWRRFLEGAGLTVEASERFEKRRPVAAWLERTGCEGELADRVRELLADRIVDGDYVDEKILLKARKGA